MAPDPRSWKSTSEVMGFGNDVARLQTLVMSPKVKGPWLDFTAAWLMKHKGKGPSDQALLQLAEQAWNERDLTYMEDDVAEDEKRDWDDDLGMGHHIHLLNLLVRKSKSPFPCLF